MFWLFYYIKCKKSKYIMKFMLKDINFILVIKDILIVRVFKKKFNYILSSFIGFEGKFLGLVILNDED